jgi:hypothetical protein
MGASLDDTPHACCLRLEGRVVQRGREETGRRARSNVAVEPLPLKGTALRHRLWRIVVFANTDGSDVAQAIAEIRRTLAITGRILHRLGG